LIEANAGNKQVLETLFNCLLLLTKIFYSLNCQDLPEFFENNQKQFMDIFLKYLKYENPILASKVWKTCVSLFYNTLTNDIAGRRRGRALGESEKRYL
jgi:hypothetical protein